MEYDLPKVLKNTLRRGGDWAEIYMEETETQTCHLEEGHIEKVMSGRDWGAGIRLMRDSKTAYGYTSELSESSFLALAQSISSAPENGSSDRDIVLHRQKPLRADPIAIYPHSVSMGKRAAWLKATDRACRELGPAIRQVHIVLSTTTKFIRIANSFGQLTEEERTYLSFAVTVTAKEGKRIETAHEVVGGVVGFEIFEVRPPEAVGIDAAKRALMLLKARPAPAGRMPVVIASEAGGTMIHECVGHGLEADLADQGLSVYAGRIGDTVAGPLITVRDDATLTNRRGSFIFDDEGTHAENTILIENGVLKNYMYDRVHAMKKGVRSTGNGRRMSYRFRPLVRMTTTLVSPGQDDPRAIVRSVERGLLVTRMGGGQVNTVNGDFMFEVQEGYLIDNGRRGDPVRGATLTGNGPEVLKTIDRVGSDLGFAVGTCGKDSQGVPVSDGLPTIRIPEMIVGGSVT